MPFGTHVQNAPTRLRSLVGDEYLQVAALHTAALMLIMSDAMRRRAARALLSEEQPSNGRGGAMLQPVALVML